MHIPTRSRINTADFLSAPTRPTRPTPTRPTSRSWLPAPPQSLLISCTRISRPRIVRRSPLICFLAAAVHVQAFPDGLSAAPLTGYAGPNSAPEVFIASGAASALVAASPSAQSPRFLHAEFAAAIRAAQVLHELHAKLLGGHFGRALGGHFYLLSPRGDRLCVQGAPQTQALHELLASPLGGHFEGRVLRVQQHLVPTADCTSRQQASSSSSLGPAGPGAAEGASGRRVGAGRGYSRPGSRRLP